METKIGYYPGRHHQNNVYAFIEHHIRHTPDRPLLKWVPFEELKKWSPSLSSPQHLPHQQITVKELKVMTDKLALGFTKLGLTYGDTIILFLPMSCYLYASMFALQKIGAIPVFLDSWARRGELGFCAKTVKPKAMISVPQIFAMCEGEEEINKLLPIVMGVPQTKTQVPLAGFLAPDATNSERKTGMSEIPETNAYPVEQEDTALITFTTGSSGTPKGANRTHRFLAAQHYALKRSLPYQEGDVDLPVFPIFSLNNMASGITTVIPAFDVGTPTEHDPLTLMAQFKANNATCATLNPYLFNKLSAYCIEHQIKLPNLRRVVTGGAPISRDNLIDFKQIAPHAEIWILYGSTEVEPMAHIEAVEMINTKSLSDEDPELIDEGVNVGHIDEGLHYRFLKIHKGPIHITKREDWDQWVLPAGSIGELIVAGEHVCNDYYNNPDAFERAKIRDEEGVVWHRTGDLTVLKEGKLWFVGRVHNVIIRNNEYLFPVRSEVVLKKLPFVKNCAYLGLPDIKLGEKTASVIVPNDNNTMSTVEMEKEVRRIMAKNKIAVDDVFFLREIPFDPRHHSKVEYDILRQKLIQLKD